MAKNISTYKETPNCYHCGDECVTEKIAIDEKVFCCNGCKAVYEILAQSELCNYYDLENKPGISMKVRRETRFDYLDNEEVKGRLLDYQDGTISKVQFYLPQIHCSACLWLLENLYKLNHNIQLSRVNFLKKEVYLTYAHESLSLKQLVELLAAIGYEPKITLDQLDEVKRKPISRRLMYQVGLAGFAFGNIMLMSLPEYFGLDLASYESFSRWFAWLNIALATPVAFYSGQDYFRSAWVSLKQKRLNIDVPIAFGVLVLFLRSFYEIVSKTGPGYLDSLCGLLFFLLLGRIFQEKIYHQLSFERDYKSYFPISITKLRQGKEHNIPINEINKGDKILVRNGELIPVDAYLIKGNGNIDNSFATGEVEPIQKKIGDKIYAGGRQIGESIQLEVIKSLDQSKLTRLWSDYAQKRRETATFSHLTDKVSQWFTPIILLIALFSGLYHWQYGLGRALEVMSAVLIVACPCALALAAPFAFGHATRWLGKQDCYLREASIIEELAKVKHIVFDKTGTLTYGKNQKLNYKGSPLKEKEIRAVWTLVNQSNHPLSRLIKDSLPINNQSEIEWFKEYEGKGLEGEIGSVKYRLGSASWLGYELKNPKQTIVVLEINDTNVGHFSIENEYRKGLRGLLKTLSKNYRLSMFSGDNDNQREVLFSYFPKESILLFNQNPEQKLRAIRSIKGKGEVVMMVGDGLNDAGALSSADIGVAIAEDVNAFSPACDIILGADQFHQLSSFLKFARRSKKVVIISFVISFLYNLVGLSLAVQGLLSPVFAAILMPVSSISVVAFVSLSIWTISKKED